MSKVVFSMILVVIVAGGFIFYGGTLINEEKANERLTELNNLELRFDCLTDQDCRVGNLTCGQCFGIDQGCLSIDSVEGICLRKEPERACTIIPERVEACRCSAGLCAPARRGGAGVIIPDTP